MNYYVLCIVLGYLGGLVSGMGINKVVKQLQGDEKITADEYKIIVSKINNDATIASDLKTQLLNQLNDYTNKVDVKVDSLHIALQGIINGVKAL